MSGPESLLAERGVMANRNKQRGSAFERLIADHFQENWCDDTAEFIDRRTLSGKADKGDLVNVRLGRHRVCVETKNCSRIDLAGWVSEAEAEAANDGALAGIVIAKRRGKAAPGAQYAVMTVDTLIAMLHAASSHTHA